MDWLKKPLTAPPKDLLEIQDACLDSPYPGESAMTKVYREIRLTKPLDFAQMKVRVETAFMAVEKAAFEYKLMLESPTLTTFPSGQATQPDRSAEECLGLLDRILEEE